MSLFTPRQHINALAPTVDGKLWVLQHNRGTSSLALVNLEHSEIERRIEGIGRMAHGIVLWDKVSV